MEEKFKEIIEEIKKSNVNPEETKKYILSIKEVLKEFYDDCKEELSDEEIIDGYLDEYSKDLEFRGNAKSIFYGMAKYEAYKSVLKEFKGNKNNFNSIIKEAKKMEIREQGAMIQNSQRDYRSAMVSAVRYIIRSKRITSDSDIIDVIKSEKKVLEEDLRRRMIAIIHPSVSMLEEYGFLDEYIEKSNKDLEKLGLAELKFSKRNPIPDEQYDLDGNLVKDVEDIGVIDALSKEELDKIPLEELHGVAAFYESKYLQRRLGISKALSVIKTLDLWDVILHGEDKDIEEFDDEKIKAALKKDIAVTYLSSDILNVTNKMRKQYRKFLISQGMYATKDIEEEANEIAPEIANLESAAGDIAILEGLIMQQLQTKSMKVKKWGVLDVSEEEAVIAIESKNFRGPLIMAVSKGIIERFCGTDESKLPQYDKEIDEKYANIMSMIYTPSNDFYTNTISNAYNENPGSELVANLAGKKVKKLSADER